MATSGAEGINPATQTLQCKGPFEVLRLNPGVFEKRDITRQYRRLALVLHPDKNKHADAEAAFKMLTAAFERLVDPSKQAECRVEAAHRRAPQRSRGDSSSAGFSSPNHGGGGGNREAPRWSREGDYVPKKERESEESTPDTTKRKERRKQDFWDDVEQQEKISKEAAAVARELNTQRKRAKVKARAAEQQRRMDSLREDFLGSDGDGNGVEAKTASWRKFNSSKPKSRVAARSSKGKQGAGVGEGATSGAARPNTNNVGTDMDGKGTSDMRVAGSTALGESDAQGRGSAKDDRMAGKKGAEATHKCWVCRRAFKSAKGLRDHESKSELHRINVQLKDSMAT